MSNDVLDVSEAAPPDAAPPTAPSVSMRDIIADAIATVRSGLGRSLGVGVAAALGIATLVGAIQLATSADAQVQARIDSERPEVLRATPIVPSADLTTLVAPTTLAALSGLDPVRAVSIVHRFPVATTASVGAVSVDTRISAVQGDLATSARLTVRGRSFTAGELQSGAHVAMVGKRVARSLTLPDPQYQPTIWLDGIAYTVIGVIDDSELAPDLVEDAVVPQNAVTADLGTSVVPEVASVIYVRADKESIEALTTALPVWLKPNAPERWRIEVPRASIDLAAAISSDLRNLSLASGALVLLIGAVGIGNAMLRSVYTRIQELGLRRALGAQTRHIAGLLLVEAGLIGVLAGLVGVIVGYLIAGAVALWNGWPLAIDLRLAAAGVLLALLAALIGAAVPARVATKVSPAEALRRD